MNACEKHPASPVKPEPTYDGRTIMVCNECDYQRMVARQRRINAMRDDELEQGGDGVEAEE